MKSLDSLPLLTDKNKIKDIALSYLSTMGMNLHQAAKHFETEINNKDGRDFITVFLGDDIAYQIFEIDGELEISPIIAVADGDEDVKFYIFPEPEDLEALKKH
jgi:ATP phosphoribosyltransferase